MSHHICAAPARCRISSCGSLRRAACWPVAMSPMHTARIAAAMDCAAPQRLCAPDVMAAAMAPTSKPAPYAVSNLHTRALEILFEFNLNFLLSSLGCPAPKAQASLPAFLARNRPMPLW